MNKIFGREIRGLRIKKNRFILVHLMTQSTLLVFFIYKVDMYAPSYKELRLETNLKQTFNFQVKLPELDDPVCSA